MSINRIGGVGYSATKAGALSPMWIFECRKDTILTGEYGAIIAMMSYTDDSLDFDIKLEDLSGIENIARTGSMPTHAKKGWLKSFAGGFKSAPTDTQVLGENPNRPVFRAKRDGAKIALTSKEIGDVFAIKVDSSNPLVARPGAVFALLPGTYIKKMDLPSTDNALLRNASGFNAMQQICGEGYALLQTRGDISSSVVSTSSYYRFTMFPGQQMLVNPDVLLMLKNVSITKAHVFSADPTVSAALENEVGFLLQASAGGEVSLSTTCQRHRGDEKKREEDAQTIKELKENISDLKARLDKLEN